MEGKESGYVARNPNNIVYDINHNDDDDGNDADVDSWGVLIAVSDKAKSRPQASSFPQARCKNYIKLCVRILGLDTMCFSGQFELNQFKIMGNSVLFLRRLYDTGKGNAVQILYVSVRSKLS